MKNCTVELTTTIKEGVTFYGIQINENTAYPYISPVKKETVRLQQQLSTKDISPVHYGEIVTDYLFDLFCEILKENGLTQ